MSFQETPVLWLGLSSDGALRISFHASTIVPGSNDFGRHCKSCTGAVSCGEEGVGVLKRSGDPRGPRPPSRPTTVRDSGEIEAHLTNLLLLGTSVILAVYGVREKKLRLSLRGVALEGHRHGRPD